MLSRMRLLFGHRVIPVVCVMAALCAVSTTALGARATQGSGYKLHLVSEPIWRSGGDPLAIRLRIVNDSSSPLTGFRLVVGAFLRVQTRSTLAESFDLSSQEPSSSFSLGFVSPSDVVPSNGSRTVTIRNKVDALQVVTESQTQGVYPL